MPWKSKIMFYHPPPLPRTTTHHRPTTQPLLPIEYVGNRNWCYSTIQPPRQPLMCIIPDNETFYKSGFVQEWFRNCIQSQNQSKHFWNLSKIAGIKICNSGFDFYNSGFVFYILRIKFYNSGTVFYNSGIVFYKSGNVFYVSWIALNTNPDLFFNNSGIIFREFDTWQHWFRVWI